MISEDVVTIGASVAAGAIGLIAIFSKLKSLLKRDSVDSAVADTQQHMVQNIQKSYESQLEAINDRVTRLDIRINSMDEVIHSQAITITRLVVVVTHLRSLLTINKIPLSEFVQTEIEDLTNAALNEPISK